jgi:hypothetical protein
MEPANGIATTGSHRKLWYWPAVVPGCRRVLTMASTSPVFINITMEPEVALFVGSRLRAR